MRTFFLFAMCLCLMPLSLLAQNTTSPYSILGIGDLDTKDYGKFFGMGSTTLAMRSATYINLGNPASLTSLDANMLHIDINGRYRSSSFRYPGIDTASTSYSDAALQRLSITFNPGHHYGMSFGLKPYSTVNYLLSRNVSLGGTDTRLLRTTDGSGGVNQVYLGNAVRIGKNFSVGLTASYLFGSLKRSTQYLYEDLDVNIQKNEYDEVRGMQFQLGLQYTGRISDRLSQHVGFVVSNPAKLNRLLSTEYVEDDSSVTSSIDGRTTFSIPLQVGLGYAVTIDDRTTIAADYKYYHWQKQSLDYPGAYTAPAQRLSVGLQHVTLKHTGGESHEKLFFQAGLAYEKGYLNIDNHSVDEMSATVGIGSNLTRLINCYVGFEFGKKGNLEYGQISENFSQLSFGLTLKEFWFNTKQVKKYD